MRFFLSGELDVAVGDLFRPVRNKVEEQLNAFCADREYGPAIQEIGVIPMILRPEWQAGRPEHDYFSVSQGRLITGQ